MDPTTHKYVSRSSISSIEGDLKKLFPINRGRSSRNINTNIQNNNAIVDTENNSQMSSPDYFASQLGIEFFS